MKSLHEFLSTLLRRKVSVPACLVEDVGRIYFYYKSLPWKSPADTEVVCRAHRLFSEIIEHTGPLRDEYEFRRRLVSGNTDLNAKESLKQKAVATTGWLDSQDTLVASQAEDILHNLYYALQMHSFDKAVLSTFDEVRDYSIWALAQINNEPKL
ncbi:hypothetical protein [Agaribacter flavus]|uniref:Uncharacterized protein n=1 Tax=Agaribacter flavus TaxID=1902781 RepID=A0ABV7FV16_9ALTE